MTQQVKVYNVTGLGLTVKVNVKNHMGRASKHSIVFKPMRACHPVGAPRGYHYVVITEVCLITMIGIKLFNFLLDT